MGRLRRLVRRARLPQPLRQPERVDAALTADAAGATAEEITRAFGTHAARAAALSRRLTTGRPPLSSPRPGFVEQLESRLRAAYALSSVAPVAPRPSRSALGRSLAAAGMAACLVAGVLVAPAGHGGVARASAAPVAAAARTPDEHAGPTPSARHGEARRAAWIPAGLARHPAADATRPPGQSAQVLH